MSNRSTPLRVQMVNSTYLGMTVTFLCRALKGGDVQGEGVFLGTLRIPAGKILGTLGKI